MRPEGLGKLKKSNIVVPPFKDRYSAFIRPQHLAPKSNSTHESSAIQKLRIFTCSLSICLPSIIECVCVLGGLS
jgi:hypothetical protein